MESLLFFLLLSLPSHPSFLFSLPFPSFPFLFLLSDLYFFHIKNCFYLVPHLSLRVYTEDSIFYILTSFHLFLLSLYCSYSKICLYFLFLFSSHYLNYVLLKHNAVKTTLLVQQHCCYTIISCISMIFTIFRAIINILPLPSSCQRWR